jgi:sorbitol-specific phosphotransferase system component IIA
MARGHKDSRDDKISTTFRTRLNRMEPQQKVRAMVVLHLDDHEVAPGRRQSPAERQEAIEAMRKSAEPALAELDHVLRHFGGKRLASNVNALGSIPVEAPPNGIAALATLDAVKAVLEDQPISLLSGPRN